MTIRYSLTKAYRNGEVIKVCVPCIISYQMNEGETVMHKIKGAWIGYIPPHPYHNYDKMICPEHSIERLQFLLGESKLHVANLELRVRHLEKVK